MEYERQVFYRSTMALALEQIDFDPGKSFRFLAWTDNLTEVFSVEPMERRSA